MDKEVPAWVGWTYLIYCMTNVIVIMGGTGYAVFEKGYSSWWFALGILLVGSGYSPWRWHCIFTGKEVPYSSFGGNK